MSALRTERLILQPAREEDLLAALDGPAALSLSLGAHVPDDWPPEFYDDDAVRYSLNALRAKPDHGGWTFYYIVRPESHGAPPQLIGAGGFKSAPDEKGEVELGYSIVASYRLQGLATEATRELCDFAFRDSRVRTVVGQTIPALIGSIGVLEKSGFAFDGAGDDPHAPEGEQLLRYVLTRSRYDEMR